MEGDKGSGSEQVRDGEGTGGRRGARRGKWRGKSSKEGAGGEGGEWC